MVLLWEVIVHASTVIMSAAYFTGVMPEDAAVQALVSVSFAYVAVIYTATYLAPLYTSSNPISATAYNTNDFHRIEPTLGFYGAGSLHVTSLPIEHLSVDMLYTQSEDVMEDPEYEEDDNEQMNVPTRSAPKSGSALNATTSLPSVDESSTHLARASQVKPTGLAAAIFGRYWDFVSQAILTVVMCWLVIAVTLNGIAIIFDPEHREYLLRTHWHATPRAPAQSLRRRSLASPLPSPPTSLHQQVDFIDCDPGVLSPDRYYRECPQDEASLDDSDSATQYFTPAVSSANLSSSTRSYEHLTSSQEPNESVYSHSFPPSHGIKACPRQTSVDLATANALFAWGFKFDGKLGQGSGGNVYSAHCRYSNRIFAVKTIRNTSYQSEYPEDCLHWLLTESRILKRIRFSAVDQHPFVVKQQYDFQKEQYIYSIMDRHVCDLHDIVEVVKKSGEHFPRSLLRFFVAEICAGVAGLHAVGIMHRDIKPANVLLARDGHIVLSDFNLAVEVDQDPNMPQVSFGYRQSKCGQTVTPILAIGPVTAGTPHFMAPEIVLGWKYGFAADWWSVGALMWMLWSGKLPYQEQIEESYPPLQGNTTWRQREAWQLKCSQELDRLTVREAPRVPRDMEECDSAFMTGLMEHNAALRLDGHAVKHHKFIKLTGYSWDAIASRSATPPEEAIEFTIKYGLRAREQDNAVAPALTSSPGSSSGSSLRPKTP